MQTHRLYAAVLVLLTACSSARSDEIHTHTDAAEDPLPYGASVRIRQAPSNEWVEGIMGRVVGCTAVMVPLGDGGFRPLLPADFDSVEIRRTEDEGQPDAWVAVPLDDVRRIHGGCSPV